MTAPSTLHLVVSRALRIALSARRAAAKATRSCSRCGGSNHDRRTCRAPALLVNAHALRRAAACERKMAGRNPRFAEALSEANTTSTHERSSLSCGCPKHGEPADVAAIGTWIERGCLLHDTRGGDRVAAKVALDALIGPQDFGAESAA